MTILLIDDTNKIFTRCVDLCKDVEVSFILASRKTISSLDMLVVKLDYTNSFTFENAFQYEFSKEKRITIVYLIASKILESTFFMNAFIDYAIEKHDVKRFVLMIDNIIESRSIYVRSI